MKVINISGDNQSGRTRALMSFVESQALDFNSKCLIVCPNKEWAQKVKNLFRLNCSDKSFSKVRFVGSHNLEEKLNGNSYDVIAFDGIEGFTMAYDERYFKVIASSRLLNKPFGTFVYTSTGKNYRVNRWVSRAVWYKPWTWKDGYYTQDVEL